MAKRQRLQQLHESRKMQGLSYLQQEALTHVHLRMKDTTGGSEVIVSIKQLSWNVHTGQDAAMHAGSCSMSGFSYMRPPYRTRLCASLSSANRTARSCSHASTPIWVTSRRRLATLQHRLQTGAILNNSFHTQQFTIPLHQLPAPCVKCLQIRCKVARCNAGATLKKTHEFTLH